jgi:hypothetical protein
MFKGKEFYFIAGLVLLYIISVVINLGYQELGAEEPRRAIISIEMQHSGNYIRATQMGEEYLNKPVLYNWILCGMMWLTGSSSEWVLRLPSLIFFLLLAVFHYRISRLYFHKQFALLSSFFVLTSLEIFFYGLMKGAEIDIFYSLVVYLQALCMFYYYEKKNWINLFLFSYILCAIGLLTKGFPSLVFQALTLAALCAYARQIRLLFKWQHLTGIIAFVALVGLYFYAFSYYGSPRKLAMNLLNESLIKSSVGDKSGKLFEKSLGYPFLLFKLIAPWALLLILLFRRKYRTVFTNPLVRFSVLFILFNIWVYWFTGQPKARYVYMFVPFACTILIGLYQELTVHNPALLKKVLGYLGWCFVLVAAGLVALPIFLDVSWARSILLFLLVALFVFYYFRYEETRIWLFILGLVITRLVFAMVMLPLQSDRDFDHRAIARDIAAANHSASLRFYSPIINDQSPQPGFMGWKLASSYRHYYLFAQVPYYYYQQTGQVVTYDSLIRPAQTYLSALSELPAQQVELLYKYYEPNQRDSFAVFRVMNAASPKAVTGP